MEFERLEWEKQWWGHNTEVWLEKFRYEDGLVVEREIIRRPPAVVVLPYDGENVYFVSQPREAIGKANFLELPAGKVDPGEEPIVAASRELREEIGYEAQTLKEITSFYSSPGFTDEVVHAFMAIDLIPVDAKGDIDERIEVVKIPLQEIKNVFDTCEDAKTLIALSSFLVALKS